MEDNSQNSNSAEFLQGWSKREKLALLDSIKVYGSHCVDQIALSLPGKSEEEIEDAIAFYKKKALRHPQYKAKKRIGRKKVHSNSNVPLASWAKVLADTIDFKELQTDTAAALHILAEYEDFPPVPPGAPDYNIDFKKIYHTLGNALEGKALPKNKVIATILEKCLVDTAVTGKSFIRKSTFKGVINSLRLSEAYNGLLPRITSKPEQGSVRYLSIQRAYNPFNICEDYLKQSVFLNNFSQDGLSVQYTT